MANLDLPANLMPFTFTAATLAAASLATLVLALRLTRSSSQAKLKLKHLPRTIPSPRDTLIPVISPQQAASLPYPPDFLPGARDVVTPYGTMRVYEWGPKDGKKVLLVHGDTTPGPMLAPIADALFDRGCRVMIFDLWGRGYSDTPLDAPHDARLFGFQIFFAAASSSLSWTGEASGGFSVIAFSLGAGITMSFAAHFPYLINSIVLLAPGGILRYLPEGYRSYYFRHPTCVPFSNLRRLVGKILGVNMSPPPTNNTDTILSEHGQTGPEVAEEVKITEKRILDVPAIVQWQFDEHKGFVHSFIDTIKHGPLMHQHSDWTKACNIIKGNTAETSISDQSSKLFNSQILVLFGDADGVAVKEDVYDDLLEMIGGPEHVHCKVVPGGHGFPVPSSDEVVKHISEFWGL